MLQKQWLHLQSPTCTSQLSDSHCETVSGSSKVSEEGKRGREGREGEKGEGGGVAAAA